MILEKTLTKRRGGKSDAIEIMVNDINRKS